MPASALAIQMRMTDCSEYCCTQQGCSKGLFLTRNPIIATSQSSRGFNDCNMCASCMHYRNCNLYFVYLCQWTNIYILWSAQHNDMKIWARRWTYSQVLLISYEPTLQTDIVDVGWLDDVSCDRSCIAITSHHAPADPIPRDRMPITWR